MGYGSADCPTDGDEGHCDGVDVDDPCAGTVWRVRVDQIQDGVPPDYACGAHQDEDEDSNGERRRICECDRTCAPDEDRGNGDEGYSSGHVEERDDGAADCESTADSSGHDAKAEAAAFEDFDGVFRNQRKYGDAEEVCHDEHRNEPGDRLMAAGVTEADSEEGEVREVGVFDVGIHFRHGDDEDEVSASEVQDGDDSEGPIGAGHCDDDADD